VKKITRVEKLGRIARDNAFELQTLAAQRVENAAVELYKTAYFATQLLTVLCRQMSYQEPDMAAAIAQKKTLWPVLFSPHRDLKERAERLIRTLQVGAKTGLNLSSGRTFVWDHSPNQVAMYLLKLAQALQRAPISEWDEQESILSSFLGRFERIESTYARSGDQEQLRALETWARTGVGRQLPPLSRSTAKAWAKATPEFFRLVFGKTFDEHPLLEDLKKSTSGRARFQDANRNVKPGGPGRIRKAMLQAVQQAWTSIAALD
jgi:hypothetical protein